MSDRVSGLGIESPCAVCMWVRLSEMAVGEVSKVMGQKRQSKGE